MVFFFGVLHHLDEAVRSDVFLEAFRVSKENGAGGLLLILVSKCSRGSGLTNLVILKWVNLLHYLLQTTRSVNVSDRKASSSSDALHHKKSCLKA